MPFKGFYRIYVFFDAPLSDTDLFVRQSVSHDWCRASGGQMLQGGLAEALRSTLQGFYR